MRLINREVITLYKCYTDNIPDNPARCKHCGRIVPPDQVFCSKKCETRNKTALKPLPQVKHCPYCGHAFTKKYKYCSRSCAVRARGLDLPSQSHSYTRHIPIEPKIVQNNNNWCNLYNGWADGAYNRVCDGDCRGCGYAEKL